MMSIYNVISLVSLFGPRQNRTQNLEQLDVAKRTSFGCIQIQVTSKAILSVVIYLQKKEVCPIVSKC